jgi:transcriptional regulator with XRE-family HTH domain
MSQIPPDLRVPIGRVVKAWRLAHGWSVTELARRAGVPKGHLSEIENEKIDRPQDETVLKLANALDVPYADLHMRRLPPGPSNRGATAPASSRRRSSRPPLAGISASPPRPSTVVGETVTTFTAVDPGSRLGDEIAAAIAACDLPPDAQAFVRRLTLALTRAACAVLQGDVPHQAQR